MQCLHVQQRILVLYLCNTSAEFQGNTFIFLKLWVHKVTQLERL